MSEKGKFSLFRKDGWVNILAGLAGKSDKTRGTYFGDYEYLDDDELTRLWLGEGLGKKIVSVVAEDMIKNWMTIQNDPDDKIMAELTRLNAKNIFSQALKWTRLYRGAIIVVGFKDGNALEAPRGNTIRGIDWLKVYGAPRVCIQQTDIVTDPKSPFFEDVEWFKVRKKSGEEVKIHRTRCLVFKGEPLPDTVKDVSVKDAFYWGTSILQSVWTRLKNYGSMEQSISNLLMEAVIGKYKLSNLAEILAENNTEAVYNRMEIINMAKSIINGVLLGENEDYIRDTVNFTGLPEMIDRAMMNLSAVADIPVTKLFGRSPAGQNATGESDSRNYYDMVAAKQEVQLGYPLQELVFYMGNYLNISEPRVDFLPIWEPSQEELIKMKKEQMETDGGYIDRGVLDPEEVRESRFGNGYSFETTLDKSLSATEGDGNNGNA